MKISALLEKLPSPMRVHLNPDVSGNATIRQICKLSAASISFSADTIYISEYSNYLSLNCRLAPSVFLLIQDNTAISEKDLPENYILYSRNMRANSLYVRLLSLMETSERVTAAKLTLSNAMLDGGTIADILEIASSLLQNPILLQDFTTRVLFSSSISSSAMEDEILHSVFTYGYVLPDLFEKYDYDNVLDMIAQEPEAFLLQSDKKNNRLIRRLNVNKKYFGWVLAVEDTHPFQYGDADIMNYLAEILTFMLEKDNYSAANTQVENLITELLDGMTSYTEKDFRQRASRFGWNIRDSFVLTVLSGKKLTHVGRNTMAAYRNHLSLLFPEAKIFVYHNNLNLLSEYRNNNLQEDRILSIVENYGLTASISDPFEQITDLPEVFREQLAVLHIGRKLNRSDRVWHFRDFVIYVAVFYLAQTGNIRHYCSDGLVRVFKYDKNHGSDLAKSKRVYLESGALNTASKKLNIHHNTLQYRLAKFNEISGIGINNRMSELELILSYYILDLFPEILDHDGKEA